MTHESYLISIWIGVCIGITVSKIFSFVYTVLGIESIEKTGIECL